MRSVEELAMSHVEILEERCKGCLLCTAACPQKLLRCSTRFNRHGYLVVEPVEVTGKACTGCASCAIMCPDVAIRVYRSPRRTGGRV